MRFHVDEQKINHHCLASKQPCQEWLHYNDVDEQGSNELPEQG